MEAGGVVDVTTTACWIGLFDGVVHPAVIAKRMSMTVKETVKSMRFMEIFL
jgi:hypothetical protein